MPQAVPSPEGYDRTGRRGRGKAQFWQGKGSGGITARGRRQRGEQRGDPSSSGCGRGSAPAAGRATGGSAQAGDAASAAHVRSPRVSPAPFPQRPGDAQGKEHQGQAVWQSHPTTPSGRRGPCPRQLLTAAGAASSGAAGRESPGRERRHSYCSGELLSLYTQKQAGRVQASPNETPTTPVPAPHPSTPPRSVSPWGIHPG